MELQQKVEKIEIQARWIELYDVCEYVNIGIYVYIYTHKNVIVTGSFFLGAFSSVVSKLTSISNKFTYSSKF